MFFEKFFNILDFFHQSRITNYLKKIDVVYFIDVGAHKGEFLSHIKSLKYKKIYCFEPQKNVFKILKKNFKNNKKIELFNIGLAHKNLNLTFYVNKLTSTSTFSRYKNSFFFKLKNFILKSDNFYIDKYKNCLILK